MATDENTKREPAEAAAVTAAPNTTPWYRRPRNLAILGVLAAAVVASIVFVTSRDSATTPWPSSPGTTITAYFEDNDITSTPVKRGDPGVPTVTFGLPRGWSDAGEDTPEGAYAAAFYDPSVDPDYPTSIVVLLSRLSGDADPAKILEYAPAELEGLPKYTAISKPKASTLSGFDAVQLGGLYTREDGNERIIAQKTVVIPGKDGLYVLQMNVDGPKDEAPVVQEATAVLDDQASITP